MRKDAIHYPAELPFNPKPSPTCRAPPAPLLPGESSLNPIIIISADQEWDAATEILGSPKTETTPYGETFTATVGKNEILFVHGGWGKIAAAGSAQYVIDRWDPDLIVNLGTCGGFGGQIQEAEVILADRTVVYDIMDQMTNDNSQIQYYSTDIDLTWLKEPYPQPVKKTILVSADRDIRVEDIPVLRDTYGAIAGDWESGAIAWVASRNRKRVLILRGVSDVITEAGSKAYGNVGYFQVSARRIISNLIDHLPEWLALAE